MKCKIHNTEMLYNDDFEVYKCSECYKVGIKARSIEDWEKYWTSQLNWTEELKKEHYWKIEVFKDFPYVIAHEYKRIKVLLEENHEYGAFLQIKDLFEVILKYYTLASISIINRNNNQTDKEEILKLIVSKPLSLGDWRSIANKIKKKFTKTELIRKILDIILKVYNNSLIDIVNWRNESIGHGALKCSKDEEYQKDIKSKLKIIKDEIFGKYYEMNLDQISMFYYNQNNEKIYLSGSEFSFSEYDELQTIFDKSKISFNYNNEEVEFYPNIMFDRKGIYFFDSYDGIKNKTYILNYPAGHKLSKTKNEIDYYFKLYQKFFDELREFNEGISDETFNKIFEEKRLDIIKIWHYCETDYLTKEINKFLEEETKGIMLLQMESGMGKTVLVNSFDPHIEKVSSRKVPDDITIRAVYLNEKYLNSGSKFYDQCKYKLSQNDAKESIIGGVTIIENNKKKKFVKTIEKYLDEYKNYTCFTSDKILLIIDGLDEVSYSEDTIFDYLPNAENLRNNIYILLTCRTNKEISEYTRTELSKINGIKKFKEYKKENANNVNLLKSFVSKLKKLKPNQINIILKKSDYKFLYVSMSKFFMEILNKNIKEIPEYSEMLNNYLNIINDEYGTKKFNKLLDILITVSTSYEALTFREICYLIGESNPTYEMIGYFEDIKFILDSKRIEGRETVYSIIHSDFKEVIIKKYYSEITDKIIHLYIPEFIRIVNNLDENYSDNNVLYKYYNNYKNDGEIYLLTNIQKYIEDFNIYSNENYKKKFLQIYLELPVHNSIGVLFSQYVLDRIIKILSNKIDILTHSNPDNTLYDKNDLAWVYMERGVAFFSSNHLLKSIEDYKKSIEIMEELKNENKFYDKNSLAVSYMNRGLTFWNLNKLDESLEGFEKSIEIMEELKNENNLYDKNDLAFAYMNRGLTLCNLNKLDESLAEYDKCIEIMEEMNRDNQLHDKNGLAKAYMNRGLTLCNLNRLEESLEGYDKCIKVIEELKNEKKFYDKYVLALSNMNKANTLTILNKIDEAYNGYNKSIEIFKELNDENKLYDKNDLNIAKENRDIILKNLNKHKIK